MLQPVVIAGGSGSRMWPLSRELYPKQFLKLLGDKTMLQYTCSRLKGMNHSAPIIVCNEEHRFIAAEQMRQLGCDHSGIVLEPVGRNTAPATALAALLAKERHLDVDPVLLVLPADHYIENDESFALAVERALPVAASGKLVTFGVKATSPETGYGYIEKGAKLGAEFVYSVKNFVEKPNQQKANEYLETGQYFWNSGIFMFQASTFLSELELYSPDILSSCSNAFKNAQCDLDFIRIGQDIFGSCPSDSIDYAIMENTQHSVVIPLDTEWSDVGSWSSLWDLSPKDKSGNATRGDVVTIDSRNNYIRSENKLVVTLGVDELVIVDTKDAVLVANKNKVQDVKLIVDHLKISNRPEYKIQREVYRPWGKYDTIDSGPRDVVKRITVRPGEKLSIQMHHHRSEHWIVVSGTAKVTNGDKTLLVTEDQSTYIPLGAIHALENPGKIPLEMIEVQTGSYLNEDDILRFEDRYGRAGGVE